MGVTAVIVAGIFIALLLTLIFCIDLPGGSQVGGGPMTKYKIIMAHFQVRTGHFLTHLTASAAKLCWALIYSCVQLLSLLRDYDVEWPALTLNLLSYSDTFNVGVSIVAPACFIQGWNFYMLYISTVAEPVRPS